MRCDPVRVILLLLLAFILSGAPTLAAAPPLATPTVENCGVAATPVAAATFPLTITDDAGRRVTLAHAPQRIVSIAPSNTEILFALGLGERVVGVDDVSDFPPEAAAKPRVGSYVEPDLERVAALQPDLILAAGLHEGNVLTRLDGLGLTTIVVEPTDLQGVLASITLVGQITDHASQAARLTCALSTRIMAVTTAVANANRPRVFFELSPDLYTAGPGSFVDDLIRRAGGDNIAAGAGTAWPQLSAEAVVAADPDVILLADHGAGVTPAQVAARPGWADVAAVRAGRIVPLNPDLVARPGPRLVDGLEAIARAIHPDRFPSAAP